jgi:hypothetical protein
LGEERKEGEWQKVNNAKIHDSCAGIGYNDMYWKMLNDGRLEGRGKG